MEGLGPQGASATCHLGGLGPFTCACCWMSEDMQQPGERSGSHLQGTFLFLSCHLFLQWKILLNDAQKYFSMFKISTIAS